MVRHFTVNGKDYVAKPFTYETVCDLEDIGVVMETMLERPRTLIRGYLAICGGLSIKEASDELQAHFVNKGKVDEIMEVIAKEIDESDFFRSFTEEEEEETPTEKKPTPKKSSTVKK